MSDIRCKFCDKDLGDIPAPRDNTKDYCCASPDCLAKLNPPAEDVIEFIPEEP